MTGVSLESFSKHGILQSIVVIDGPGSRRYADLSDISYVTISNQNNVVITFNQMDF